MLLDMIAIVGLIGASFCLGAIYGVFHICEAPDEQEDK